MYNALYNYNEARKWTKNNIQRNKLLWKGKNKKILVYCKPTQYVIVIIMTLRSWNAGKTKKTGCRSVLIFSKVYLRILVYKMSAIIFHIFSSIFDASSSISRSTTSSIYPLVEQLILSWSTRSIINIADYNVTKKTKHVVVKKCWILLLNLTTCTFVFNDCSRPLSVLL